MPAKKKSRVSSRGDAPFSKRNGAATKSSHTELTHAVRLRGGARSKDALWVASKTSLTRPEDEGVTSWNLDSRTARDARLLELADIALGLRKPESFRKRKSLFLNTHNAKRAD